MEITNRIISRGVGGGEWGGKVQGIRSMNGRFKIDRGRLRKAWELEKPKNLYVKSIDMNWRAGNAGGSGGCKAKGNKGEEKIGQL